MTQIQRGVLLFSIKCQRCHGSKETDDYGRGPNLWGVVGRKAGTQGLFNHYQNQTCYRTLICIINIYTGYKKYSDQLKKVVYSGRERH